MGLPTHRIDRFDELASAAAIGELAEAAEEAGFDGAFVTEHPFPDDRWLAKGGHHSLDPFVALAFAAAATTSLRLQTNLCIAAYRNPFLLAKSVATLDALSGGRMILGIGTGYLEGEFAALGSPFDERNDRTDEAIRAMRAAWTGESVEMKGEHFLAAGNTMLPAPAQPGGPPIWIGGNAKRAIRRAVELADGWVPMPNPARSAARRRTPALETLEDLHTRIQEAHAVSAAAGRAAPLEIVFMPLGLDMFTNAPVVPDAVIESIQALAAVGVTYVTTSVPGETRAEVLANLAIFRDAIIPAVRGLEGKTG
ncbi:MAG: TIGR03619 family F420-dependent LLM class oxidoreductase [Acidimicrobiia bacterium]|nr:TIGR03619 family F420-dependent LLM class oxidoreductase [Acidimicrobiia bacterium]